MSDSTNTPRHPQFPRRAALQAGAIGLLGLGMNHLSGLQALGKGRRTTVSKRNVIYIFLSGGLAQQDSFDLKPNAPEGIRGEFKPIATGTPDVQICEHLPMLAQRSQHWSLVRSLTHPYNEHSQGHMVMLSGRTPLPLAFSANQPKVTDWPSVGAIANYALQARNSNLPPAVILPEVLVHRTGRVIPGQFAAQMGMHWDPWYVKASPYNPKGYGAYPEYGFHHERGAEDPGLKFEAPNLSLPEGLSPGRLGGRLGLLQVIERQRAALEQAAEVEQFDQHRQQAVSLLAEPEVQQAFDVVKADAKTLDRYGRNSFGWSLLMARRLVESGVNLVQVNLGNNETWDTHQNAFPNLKNFLFPPTDRAVSALLDDLAATGLLDETLVVMAGEFGRTPRVFKIPKAKQPGRDHWGAVQTVFLAGGNARDGKVVGSSDKIGGHPAADPQTPESLAATIYKWLGIPREAAWHDANDRPHFIYHGDPIEGVS